jgi:hypothetical protein
MFPLLITAPQHETNTNITLMAQLGEDEETTDDEAPKSRYQFTRGVDDYVERKYFYIGG